MKRSINIFVGTCIIYYIIAGFGIFIYQEKLIFYPQERAILDKKFTTTMESFSHNIVISSYKRGGEKAVIYFGGNAEDVSVSLLALANALPDHSIYMMNYRGYGGSQGTPGEAVIYKDAVKLYELLRMSHKRISVVGRSLGTGFAIHLASEKSIDKLVLITPYNSFEDLAHDKLPIYPMGIMLKHKFQSYKYAPMVKAKTIILAAEIDEIVPRESTQELYNYFARGLVSMKVIHGSDHNSIIFSREYYTVLTDNL